MIVMDAGLFSRITQGEPLRLDPVRRATRHAWRLLEQYGEELVVNLDDQDRVVDEDIKSNSSIQFSYLSTDTFLAGENHSFSIDQLPETCDDRLITDVGFVALHMTLFDDEGESMQNDQVVFRLEEHELGPAIFQGKQYSRQVKRPECIADINRGLSVIEEQMHQSRINDPYSSINNLPESEIAQRMSAFIQDDRNS